MNQQSDEPVLNEELWRIWRERGRQRRLATTRRNTIAFAFAMGILALAGIWRFAAH